MKNLLLIPPFLLLFSCNNFFNNTIAGKYRDKKGNYLLELTKSNKAIWSGNGICAYNMCSNNGIKNEIIGTYSISDGYIYTEGEDNANMRCKIINENTLQVLVGLIGSTDTITLNKQ